MTPEIDWPTIKNKIYHQDGSLRDIYVLDITLADWKKWIHLVNETYPLSFYNCVTEQTEPAIALEVALDWLEGKIDLVLSATLALEAIMVKCYFFSDSEIENDIDPREIRSMEDHNRVVDYMKTMSTCLQKPVILTEENTKSVIHILVNEDKVELMVN